MMSHAGTDFLQGQMEEAKSELAFLREQISAGVAITQMDNARIAYERARVGYYEQLIQSRANET